MPSSRFGKSGMAHPGYVYDIMPEMSLCKSAIEIKPLETVHTKYEVNPSILGGSMPKKIYAPQNLGIKSLTAVVST